MATCMKNVEIGQFTKSIAGHDKDKLFVIIKIEAEYVYLVDGKTRTLESPKKKKMKHIQPIHEIDKTIKEKLDSNIELRNEDIKLALKCYKKAMIEK